MYFYYERRKVEEVVIYISGAFRNEKTRDRSRRNIYKNKLLEGNKLLVEFMLYEESLTRYYLAIQANHKSSQHNL